MSMLTTTKYDMFQLLDFNRDVIKTRKLEESMKKHGYINAYPLHVVKDGGKLKIKGGHHRFTVAVKLGLPVAYVVCSDTASIHELEAATVKWNMDDYMISFVRLGNPHYIQVQRYCERTKIKVGQAISMLAGEMASNGNQGEVFKRGEYVVKETEHAETVASLVDVLKNSGVEWAATQLVVTSLSRIYSANVVDIPRLKTKIKANASLIKKQPNLISYMEMWEKIYNRSSHNEKIPLVFLVNEAIEKRKLLFSAQCFKNAAKS